MPPSRPEGSPGLSPSVTGALGLPTSGRSRAIRLGGSLLVGAARTLVLAVLFSASPQLAHAEIPVGNLTEIQFEGNSSIPAEQVLAKMKSRAGRPLEASVIEDDLRLLMKSGWFADVRTFYKPDKARGGFILIVQVVEMPILHSVEYRGRSKLKLKDLEEASQLKVGGRSDHVKHQLAVNAIKRLYEEKGYLWAEVRLLEGGKADDNRVVFEIFEGPKCKLQWVTFTGNAFVSDQVLQTKVSSHRKILGALPGEYHRDQIEDDARRLREYYQAQGFFEVKITPLARPAPNQGDMYVEFVIWEGAQYKVRDIRFEGNDKIATAKLREGLVMHSGQPFSDALREADRKTLETKYGAIGCIDAVITAEREYTEKHGVVDLVYKVDEGVPYLLGRMRIVGNARTKSKVLLREANMAGLVPGEPLDANRITTYRSRLMNLRYFAATPEGGQKPLEIKITNRRPGDQPYGEIPTIDLQEVIRAKLEAAGLQAGSDGEGGVVRARFQDPGDDPPRRDGGWQAQDGATRSVTRAPARVAQAPVDDPLPPIEPPAIGDVPPALEAPPVEGGIPPVIAPGPPVVQVPVLPGGPGAEGPRTPPIGSGEPPGTFPSLPGANMTDVGPDRSDPFPNRSYADIVTQVDEVPTGRLMFGLGATSYGGLSGSFILHESNFDLFALPRSLSDFRNGSAFRGAGQDFRVELSPGTLINRAVVSFRDPYLFDLPIGLGLSGYYFQRIYNGLYTENRGGGRFSLGRQFGTQIYGDVAFRIEDVDFHGFTNPAPASYLAAAGHTTLATLRPSLRFDNRNDPFSPNKGQYLEAAFEQGWGTFTFPKFTVEGRQYVPLGSRPDGSGKRFLTLRGYYGITGTDTPVYERFYAGDFRSMRGFTYRGVGPRELNVNVGGLSMALGSVEFQFPWTANDKLQQVIFTDFGTVSNTLDLTGFRLAVGTGLRIYLPQQAFGPLPLAFDFAVPIVKEEGDRTQYFTFFIGAFW